MSLSQSSHEFTPPGRNKLSNWERAQQIAKIVDRAQSKSEGSADYTMYKDKAERLISDIVTARIRERKISIPITPRLVLKELRYIKLKLMKLIEELP